MENEELSFEELFKQSLKEKETKLEKTVTGKIITITDKGEIFVDINYKSDGIIPKKEYEKLTLKAEKYKQIEEKNKEIKANINTVKEAHKALQSDINASKTILKEECTLIDAASFILSTIAVILTAF